MQVLPMREWNRVSAGLFDNMSTAQKGGMIGGAEGAVVGGVLSLPFWAMAGESGPVQMLGVAITALSMATFSLAGGVVGLCTGYVMSYAQAK